VYPGVFHEVDKTVLVFHEFVHCFQFGTCEPTLKQGLAIAQHYHSRGVFDWELTYPFPYDNKSFVELYKKLLSVSETEDVSLIMSLRKRLRECLLYMDYEYMVWVEWKKALPDISRML